MAFIYIGQYAFNASDISVYYENVKNKKEIEKFKIYYGVEKTPPKEEIETVIAMRNGLIYNIEGAHFKEIKIQLSSHCNEKWVNL